MFPLFPINLIRILLTLFLLAEYYATNAQLATQLTDLGLAEHLVSIQVSYRSTLYGLGEKIF